MLKQKKILRDRIYEEYGKERTEKIQKILRETELKRNHVNQHGILCFQEEFEETENGEIVVYKNHVYETTEGEIIELSKVQREFIEKRNKLYTDIMEKWPEDINIYKNYKNALAYFKKQEKKLLGDVHESM